MNPDSHFKPEKISSRSVDCDIEFSHKTVRSTIPDMTIGPLNRSRAKLAPLI